MKKNLVQLALKPLHFQNPKHWFQLLDRTLTNMCYRLPYHITTAYLTRKAMEDGADIVRLIYTIFALTFLIL